NPYASPRPFYELIINCNDVLKHFQIMYAEKRLNESEFKQRYSDIGALRSFLYLQLGIHFGEVPYVTSPIENVDDVKNASLFPKLKLQLLIDSLINFTEALPFKDVYPTEKFYVNKKCLLGDLYLWKSSFEPANTTNYVKAAEWYRQVMELATQ